MSQDNLKEELDVETVTIKQEIESVESVSITLEREPAICVAAVDVKVEPLSTEEESMVQEKNLLKTEVFIKEEPRETEEWGVSEAAAEAELYARHEIKQELVIGPEGVQPPTAGAREAKVKCEREEPSAAEGRGGRKKGRPRGSKTKTNKILDKTFKVPNSVRTKTASRHVSKKPSGQEKEKIYICDYCNKTYTRRGSLVQHIIYHTTSKPYYCAICDKYLARHTSKYDHQRIHTGEKPLSCNTCSKRFSCSSSLIKHKRIHLDNKPYRCEVCSKQFREKSQLTLHALIHQGDAARRYPCKFCSKKFLHRYRLVNHERVHTGDKPFVCKICNEAFTRNHQLTAHLLVHTEAYRCKLSPTNFTTSSDFNTHLHNPSGACVNPLVCEICKKTFKCKTELVRHQLIHTGLRPHPCGLCGKAFTQIAHLQAHKLTHSGEKLYDCELCKARFASKRYLTKHMKRLHSSSEPPKYVCWICNKQFPRACNLKLHEKAHARKHICGVCGKECRNTWNLKMHVKTHGEREPEQQ